MNCENWTLIEIVAFLEISRNRLTALKARQAALAFRTHFLGFCYALPGG